MSRPGCIVFMIAAAVRAGLVAAGLTVALTVSSVVTIAWMERDDLIGGGSLAHSAIHSHDLRHDGRRLLRSGQLHDQRGASRVIGRRPGDVAIARRTPDDKKPRKDQPRKLQWPGGLRNKILGFIGNICR